MLIVIRGFRWHYPRRIHRIIQFTNILKWLVTLLYLASPFVPKLTFEIQSLIQPYSADVFRGIHSPHVSGAAFKSRDVKSIVSKHIIGLFSKHGVEGDFSINLLHRHGDLADDQRLVCVGRVMAPWSTGLMDMVEPSLGKISPQALLVHNGKYYPYEFIHLSEAEAASWPDDGIEGFKKYHDFMEEFAEVVERQEIADVIGLRLLSAEDRARAANPNVWDYEINDEAGIMITLSADHELDNSDKNLAVRWEVVDGDLRCKMMCRGLEHGEPPTPDD